MLLSTLPSPRLNSSWDSLNLSCLLVTKHLNNQDFTLKYKKYPPPASVEQVQHAPDGGLLHLWQDEDWLHGGKEQVSQETRLTGEES